MLLENGIWISSNETRRGANARPALFLDRDGVVVKEVHYLSRTEDVVLELGAVELIGWARQAGLAVVVVTNQSGVARGLFGWAAFEAVEAEVARQLAAHGVDLDLVIACAFHEEHTNGFGPEHARWRKPGPAMIELAGERLGIDLAASWMVGDRVSDVGAAHGAGLAGAVHVLTGHGVRERAAAERLATEGFRVLNAADPMEALQLLRTALARRLA
jgi:D-glycero-D-manno-heptose 1,7-bisphosphate phosphatase